jgi:hypothetical protein
MLEFELGGSLDDLRECYWEICEEAKRERTDTGDDRCRCDNISIDAYCHEHTESPSSKGHTNQASVVRNIRRARRIDSISTNASTATLSQN